MTFFMTFLDNTFFILCSCFRTHPTNTTSQNIGGADAWAFPNPKFWGDRPPSSPRSPPMVISMEILLGRVPKGQQQHQPTQQPQWHCFEDKQKGQRSKEGQTSYLSSVDCCWLINMSVG